MLRRSTCLELFFVNSNVEVILVLYVLWLTPGLVSPEQIRILEKLSNVLGLVRLSEDAHQSEVRFVSHIP